MRGGKYKGRHTNKYNTLSMVVYDFTELLLLTEVLYSRSTGTSISVDLRRLQYSRLCICRDYKKVLRMNIMIRVNRFLFSSSILKFWFTLELSVIIFCKWYISRTVICILYTIIYYLVKKTIIPTLGLNNFGHLLKSIIRIAI